MRSVVQRVDEAQVLVDGVVVGSIRSGLCVFVGVTHSDTLDSAHAMATKVLRLRIFNDANGVMNLALPDVGGEVLVVSQFTLYGDTRRGRRPSWAAAAPGPDAEPLVAEVAAQLARLGATVAMGVFGARMQVHLLNDGPVTLIVET